MSKLWAAMVACGVLGAMAGVEPATAERAIEGFYARRTPGEVSHLFRYPPGDPRAGAVKSGWRIAWTVIEPLPPDGKRIDHEYGEAAILELTSVAFMRGADDGAEGAWLPVLSNLALSELYTFYNAMPKKEEGPAVGPIQQEVLDMQHDAYTFAHFIDRDDLARLGFAPLASSAEVLGEDGVVVKEVRDDGIRAVFFSKNDPQSAHVSEPVKAVRGETLVLWALLKAGNYYYVVEYSFVDDGTIRVRVGASGNNYYLHQVGSNSAVHQHFACWRMAFADGGATDVHILENVVAADRKRAQVVRRPFNKGREGGETWNAERFGALEVLLSPGVLPPPAYVLVPRRSGSGRAKHALTSKDFWVTVQEPQAPGRREANLARNSTRSTPDSSERRCADVPAVVASHAESLRDRPLVVWHQAAFLHIPRKEDFGATHHDPHAALTAWMGFDLAPRNVWERTPFLEAQR